MALINLILIILLSWAVINCGNNAPPEKKIGELPEDKGKKEENSETQEDSQALKRAKFRVAIIDDGFDTSLPIFEDKIVAKMTVKCSDSGGTAGQKKVLSYEDLKQKMIESLESPSDDCELVEDISFKKSKSFSSIEGDREEWNKRVSSKNPKSGSMSAQTSQKIIKILSGEGKYNYHGTQVASFVAYKNPNVEFVFIQIDLAKGKDEQIDKIECQTQAEIDQSTKLYKDPDVKKALEKSPLSGLEKKLDKILVKHQVDFINTSFGIPVTKELEKMYAEKGCGKLKYGKNIAAEAEFTRLDSESKVKRGLLKTHALTISALGNDGAEVNTPEASDRCASHYTLNVGALNAKGKVASFSNYGKCADVYIGGEDVIAMAPEGFLIPNSGTSFSSPLFLRYLTQTLKSPQDSYKDVYEKWKGAGKKLTGDEMPQELFFDNKDVFSGFQLTGNPADQPRDTEKIRSFVDPVSALDGRRFRGIRLP